MGKMTTERDGSRRVDSGDFKKIKNNGLAGVHREWADAIEKAVSRSRGGKIGVILVEDSAFARLTRISKAVRGEMQKGTVCMMVYPPGKGGYWRVKFVGLSRIVEEEKLSGVRVYKEMFRKAKIAVEGRLIRLDEGGDLGEVVDQLREVFSSLPEKIRESLEAEAKSPEWLLRGMPDLQW